SYFRLEQNCYLPAPRSRAPLTRPAFSSRVSLTCLFWEISTLNGWGFRVRCDKYWRRVPHKSALIVNTEAFPHITVGVLEILPVVSAHRGGRGRPPVNLSVLQDRRIKNNGRTLVDLADNWCSYRRVFHIRLLFARQNTTRTDAERIRDMDYFLCRTRTAFRPCGVGPVGS